MFTNIVPTTITFKAQLVFQITDHVTGASEKCVQVHPGDDETGSCADACQTFENQVLRDFTEWYMDYVGEAVQQWDALRLLAEEMAAIAMP